MSKYISILCSIAILIGCSDASHKGFKNLPIEHIVLTSHVKQQSFYSGHVSYRPTYLGQKLDSIHLDSTILESYGYNKSNKLFKVADSPKTQIVQKPKIPKDSNDIRIYVDTTQTIPNLSSLTAPPVLNLSDTFNISSYIHHSSYPIFIENISLDTIHIGSTNVLPFHLQILSPSKTWIKTNQFMPGCGTGQIPYYLPPNSILIIPHPISRGNMITKFRFAYGFHDLWGSKTNFIYSNEFYGNIDSSFFEQKIPF